MQMACDMYIPKCKSYANIPRSKVLILKDMQQGASHKMAFTFPLSSYSKSPSSLISLHSQLRQERKGKV